MIPLFSEYIQELNESRLPYSFDLDVIQEDDIVKDITGTEYIVKSIENNDIVICENEIGEFLKIEPNDLVIKKDKSLFWFDAIKAIIAIDIIKMGGSFSGGGVAISGQIYNKWRNVIATKLQSIRVHPEYISIKSQCDKLASILNSELYLLDTFKELSKYPYADTKFISSFIGKNAKKKIEENKIMRKQLIKEIGDHIIGLLSEEDIQFIKKLNEIIK